MNRKHIFIRDLTSDYYLDSFFVSAITAVLGIRWFLKITNYIQIGGTYFHIAHVLWGGMFMLIALIILIAFINQRSRQVASVIGGFGFGLFIDEIGKFITHDNNYFYQPAIAIVYIIFVLLYLSIQLIEKFPRINEAEKLANVLENMKLILTGDFDSKKKYQTEKYLESCDPNNPLVINLKSLLQDIGPSTAKPSFLYKISHIPKSIYTTIIRTKHFFHLVIIYFTIQSVLSLVQTISLFDNSTSLTSTALTSIGILEIVILLVTGVFHYHRHAGAKVIRILISIVLVFIGLTVWNIFIDPQIPTLSFISWGRIISSTIAGIFTIAGISRIRASRLTAYKMFRYSTLTTIFFTQVFTFYQSQLSALLGLSINILTLIALRFLMDQHHLKLKKNSLPVTP